MESLRAGGHAATASSRHGTGLKRNSMRCEILAATCKGVCAGVAGDGFVRRLVWRRLGSRQKDTTTKRSSASGGCSASSCGLKTDSDKYVFV